MTSQVIEREGWAEVRHDEYLPNGGVFWVKIELRQQGNGVLFVSPVDNDQHLVENITIKTLEEEWFHEDYASDILDGIAQMGGSRWIMGSFTEYDLIESDGKFYLEVTEVIRGDADDHLKEMKGEFDEQDEV